MKNAGDKMKNAVDGVKQNIARGWDRAKQGFSKNKDEDCTQKINDKAADRAAGAFKLFDQNGDDAISFCEYAQVRNVQDTLNDATYGVPIVSGDN